MWICAHPEVKVDVSEANFLYLHDDFNLNQCVIFVELIVEGLLDTLVNNLRCNCQCHVLIYSISLFGKRMYVRM